MKEATTEYILTKHDEIAYKNIQKIMKKSLVMQRFLYFTEQIPKSYQATLIVDNEDKLSVIDKNFRVTFGNYGIFIKQTNNSTGVTYHKKGRSSSRIKYWGMNKPMLRHNLISILANKINPSCVKLIDDIVIKTIVTPGMQGSFISGKITNTTEAMSYFIRYSLRGIGINQIYAENLYDYYKYMSNTYQATQVLRTAKDPNAILKVFIPKKVTQSIKEEITSSNFKVLISAYGRRLINLSMVTNEKIDWVNSEMDPNDELVRLSKKEKWIKDISELWDGGPILSKGSSHPVISYNLPF